MNKILLNYPFAQISEHEIDHIFMHGQRQQNFKGSFLFLADESYPKLGICCQAGSGNKRKYLEIDDLDSLGSLFGETYACMGLPKIPVSVEAVEDCIVLLLDINLMLRTCDNACQFHQRLISNLLKIIATKNMMLNRKMSYITHKTIRGRLLAFLEDQAERAKSNIFEIPFNRNELADYLCVDRSAMSRELGRMKKEGLLDFNRKTFRLQV